jgi:Spy/CpxP family protein refolding chaperone
VPVGTGKERKNIMKPQIIFGALLAMTIGSVSAAWADRDCDCRPGGPEWRKGHRPAVRGPGQGNREHEERDFARIGKARELTEVQKAKIEGIVQAERDMSAPLRQKLEESWTQIRQAEQAAKFDEAAVRTIATSQAQRLTDMMVARARAQNQIHALLTTEQRAIVDKLRPPIDDGGPGYFRLPRHECGPGHFRPPGQMCVYGGMPHCGCE